MMVNAASCLGSPNNFFFSEYSMYVAIIKGNAFLWHQIRFIMGVLFLIGSGKEAPSLVTELLDVDKNPRYESF